MTRRVYRVYMALSPMTFQNIPKTICFGPPIVGNLAMMLIGVTDIVMVGWHSVEELAALILATTLFFNIFIWALVLLCGDADGVQRWAVEDDNCSSLSKWRYG